MVAGSAHAATVAVRFGPAGDLGAVGLMVPGKGPTVTRAETLAALGELPRCEGRCDYLIYVSLPPRESRHNVTRYRVAIAGTGYEGGLLLSSHTRIPGLLAADDVGATARALARGEQPPVTARPDRDAGAELRVLDRRLARAHDARDSATLLMVSLLTVYGLIGLVKRSRLFALAAVLVPPVAMVTALILSGVGAGRPSIVLTALGVATAAGSLAASALLRDDRALGAAFVLFLLAYLIVMWTWPVTNSLAVIGPHPDGGGRYYGVTNEMSTLMLAPALLAGCLLGRAVLLPVTALALVTVGASFSGADGGGVLTLVAGFLMLGLRMTGRLEWRRVTVATGAAAALAFAFVGLDAAFGSSHVTRAVGGGPDDVLGDWGHRLHVSWDGVTSSWYHVLLMLIALAALVFVATRRPRFAVVDALLVAIVVSLLVNDTPVDVAGFGALSAVTLWSWRRAEQGVE